FIVGSVLGLTFGLTDGLVVGLTGGTAVGLVAWLVFGTINGLVQTSADASSAIDPIGCWRNDRRSGFAEGLAYGLVVGLAYGLAGWLAARLETGLAAGLIGGLGEGVAFTFAVSQAWLATLGFIFLSFADRFPRQGLRFLEDARERGVLRTVGSVYQFRHARLQDQLATTYTQHRTAR
ncbi:MAG: NACHT domain-containing protein, partial [Actinobacteria bacterium]|nr:NACHT domain-containing protein [Actinomycetota bacterium]